MHDYLIQRFGGHSAYSDRRGLPCLVNRHTEINISAAAADRWLDLMEDTLDEMADDFDDDTREKMMYFFRYTAFLFVANAETVFESSRCTGEFAYLLE